VAFDTEELARLELGWWQARREAVGPRDYGRTIAEVAALTYGKSAEDPAISASGIARAEAMAYRDARREDDRARLGRDRRPAAAGLQAPEGPASADPDNGGHEKSPGAMPGLSGFQVRERSVPRSNRGSAPEVKAVNQGGHDGLSEELVIGKETGE
jgi:hypothetical protein